MKRDDPRLISAADQVLAILRDSRETMTATEIGKQMPRIATWVCDHGRQSCTADPSTPRGGAFWSLPAYQPLWAVHLGSQDAIAEAGCPGGMVTPVLTALARQGLVERTKIGRRVHWRAVGANIVMAAFDDDHEEEVR